MGVRPFDLQQILWLINYGACDFRIFTIKFQGRIRGIFTPFAAELAPSSDSGMIAAAEQGK